MPDIGVVFLILIIVIPIALIAAKGTSNKLGQVRCRRCGTIGKTRVHFVLGRGTKLLCGTCGSEDWVHTTTNAAIGVNPSQTADVRKCPFCAELVKREATVCRYCAREIKSVPPPLPTEEQIEQLWRKSGIGRPEGGAPLATGQQGEESSKKPEITKPNHLQTHSPLQRESQFYILQGSDVIGPFDKERLLELRKSGDIGDNDFVRKEGVEGWIRLAAITDLS